VPLWHPLIAGVILALACMSSRVTYKDSMQSCSDLLSNGSDVQLGRLGPQKPSKKNRWHFLGNLWNVRKKLPQHHPRPTVMVLTFNQENVDLGKQEPVLDALVQGINAAPEEPDLIFFCEQEATGSRLSKLLQTKMANYSYDRRNKDSMRGMTKATMNKQSLSMLYRKQRIKGVSFASEAHRLSRSEGKGGIVAKVKFKQMNGKGGERNYSVGVACAHLDSKNAFARESQLETMIEAVKGTGAELQLLSGDLNFRSAKIYSLKTRADLVNMLSTKAGVEKIFSYDTLAHNQKLLNSGCSCNQPGVAGQMYGPTYKRDPFQNKCGEYSGSFPRENDSIEACFLAGKPANESLDESDFKKGEHQLGYLDRLCTCTEPVKFVYQKGLEEVTVSDHIPVINMVRMTG